MLTPAENLEGHYLDGGWYVKSRVPKDPKHTGGYFSIGYIVESEEGEIAFLKALDLKKVISTPGADRVTRIRDLTAAYVYERDLLKRCRTAKLKRIIKCLDDGELDLDGEWIPYIIFEIAYSDVRQQANDLNRFDSAWALRTMHHTAVGIKQLHGQEIAHQDIKPSNILITEGENRKLGDLGRSATKECTLGHMDSCFTGDNNYAPPEALFGYLAPEWRDRRYGSDCYQLGSLLVFMLTGVSMTTLLCEAIEETLRPSRISGGDNYNQILPYLIDAHLACLDFIREFTPETKVTDEIIELINQLCHPDLNQRGDQLKRRNGANPFDMERFISKFERIATGLERNLYGITD